MADCALFRRGSDRGTEQGGQSPSGSILELGFPAIRDEEVEAATYAHGSKDMPDRNVVEDLKAAEEMMKRGITGLDIVKALAKPDLPRKRKMY